MSNSDETTVGDELVALASRLPREVSPEHDLWPGIEQTITAPAKPARTSWNSPWAQAAAVVLLVAGSSGITYVVVKDDSQYRGPAVVSTDRVFETVLFEPVSGDFGQKYTLGNKYMAARYHLEDGLEETMKALPPQERDELVDNLNTIRVAIRDINTELVKEPDNILLQNLLLNAYHEEMSLMTKIDRIGTSAMRRNDI